MPDAKPTDAQLRYLTRAAQADKLVDCCLFALSGPGRLATGYVCLRNGWIRQLGATPGYHGADVIDYYISERGRAAIGEQP